MSTGFAYRSTKSEKPEYKLYNSVLESAIDRDYHLKLCLRFVRMFTLFQCTKFVLNTLCAFLFDNICTLHRYCLIYHSKQRMRLNDKQNENIIKRLCVCRYRVIHI